MSPLLVWSLIFATYALSKFLQSLLFGSVTRWTQP